MISTPLKRLMPAKSPKEPPRNFKKYKFGAIIIGLKLQERQKIKIRLIIFLFNLVALDGLYFIVKEVMHLMLCNTQHVD